MLLDNMLLYYKLDETSGTNPQDSSVNARHGTLLENASPNTGGKINYGVALDGWNDGILGPSLKPSSGCTLACWVKQSSIGGYKSPLGWRDATNTFIECYIDPNNAIYSYVYDTGSSTITRTGRFTPVEALPTGLDWHHIAVTYDGGTAYTSIKIYVDSVQVDTSNIGGAGITEVQNQNVTITFGHQPGVSPNSIAGLVDECGAWARVLSLEELQTLYNMGSGLSYDLFTASRINSYTLIDSSILIDSGVLVGKGNLIF